ncbi:hypothetical protein [Leptodesmis sp.]|uniref:hypothetical protein n=1 Tax=Leptodesmis sp. TaxID=3100501 RepID=UPI0040534B4D
MRKIMNLVEPEPARKAIALTWHSDPDNVIPDVVWISTERLSQLMDKTGHLTAAPELVMEVLSPRATNERPLPKPI